ncbi:zeta toxin family protein [Terriglobus sp.]|uniref:zeta toxin family protein n=1 Tax=Terriglobus sp. TaxID=1889013 RepID=UPI003B00DD4C
MNGKPQLWVFCGPNGAGKSTLAKRFLKDRLSNVNPDVVAQALPRRPDGSLAELEAGRIALKQRRILIAAGESFAFETTLSGNTELASLRAAHEKGYKVNVIFVGLQDAERSEARVAERVSLGGHDVPQDAIHRRYKRAMLNLAEAAAIADRVIIFENSEQSHRLLLIREDGEVRHHAPFPEWARRWLPAEYQVKEQGT